MVRGNHEFRDMSENMGDLGFLSPGRSVTGFDVTCFGQETGRRIRGICMVCHRQGAFP